MLKLLKLLFSYRGRLGRAEFWFGPILAVTALGLLLKIGRDYAGLPFQQDSVLTVGGAVILAWIATAGLTKRLHDRGRSGWLQVVFFLPLFGYATLTSVGNSHPAIPVLALAASAAGLWLIAEVGLLRGNLGKNRFGSDKTLFAPPTDHWKDTPAPWQSNRPDIIKNDGDSEKETIDSWLSDDNSISDDMPEILKSTSTAFAPLPNEQLKQPGTDRPPLPPEPIAKPEPAATTVATLAPAELAAEQRAVAETQKSTHETERFLEILKQRATTSPAHALYLQRGAMAGNSWAKLEISATWLSDAAVTSDNAKLAIKYLREVADSSQSYLGAEREAAYFLGEIYRVGMRFSYPNEDLSFKYFVRAASLGHEAAQRGLAAQIARALHQGEEGSSEQAQFQLQLQPQFQPLVDAALTDTASAATLLKLIEFDWSITYAESIGLILKTLVDQGNPAAAKFLGRMLLEQGDLDAAIKILARADQLDPQTIDKMAEIIQASTASDQAINALVDLLQKHADLDDAHAHYQIARAYAAGLGKPQDNIMAYMHVSLAAARTHGQAREALTNFSAELKQSLSTTDIATAQEMIRTRYHH